MDIPNEQLDLHGSRFELADASNSRVSVSARRSDASFPSRQCMDESLEQSVKHDLDAGISQTSGLPGRDA